MSEFILLSDILGLSALVNAQSNPKPAGCTESTILGPFHTDDAAETSHGASIASKATGPKLLVQGQVRDRKGNAIKGRVMSYIFFALGSWLTMPRLCFISRSKN